MIVSYIGYHGINKDIQLIVGQEVEQFFQSELKELPEVVVTDSRGIVRSNLQSPALIDLIDNNAFLTIPQVSLTQNLNYVAPSFNSNTQVISDGTDHIDSAILRGLGPNQVLVLIKGKRRHTTSLVNINGKIGKGSVGTDLNAIPVSAIKK